MVYLLGFRLWSGAFYDGNQTDPVFRRVLDYLEVGVVTAFLPVTFLSLTALVPTALWRAVKKNGSTPKHSTCV